MLAVGLVLGLGLGAQVRTALAIRTHLHVLPAQVEELGYRLRRQERAQDALEAQVLQMRARLSAYEVASATQQVRLTALSQQLQGLKALTGLTAVTGAGVVVELEDSQRPLLPGENPNEVILHNYDVVLVVNELWAAGTEAMAVNGQRIIPTTAIRSVATTMMVNTKRIAPPIRIEAIGDPDRLARYVRRPGGYLGLLQAFTFPTRVTRTERLMIPAYKGPLIFKYIQPLPIRER